MGGDNSLTTYRVKLIKKIAISCYELETFKINRIAELTKLAHGYLESSFLLRKLGDTRDPEQNSKEQSKLVKVPAFKNS